MIMTMSIICFFWSFMILVTRVEITNQPYKIMRIIAAVVLNLISVIGVFFPLVYWLHLANII